jgi:hypothetical protein
MEDDISASSNAKSSARSGKDCVIPPALKALCPVTLPELVCSAFCKAVASKWRPDRTHEWARVMYCSCGKDWLVCGLCPGVRTRFVTTKSINQHNRTNHSNNESSEGIHIPPNKKTKNDAQYEETSDSMSTVKERKVEEVWVKKVSLPMKTTELYGLLSKETMDHVCLRETSACAYNPSTVITASSREFGNRHSTLYFNSDINGSGIADAVALCPFGTITNAISRMSTHNWEMQRKV